MSSNNIVVVGSCMIDFVSYVTRLPKEGETIHGSKFVTTFGGKGANQCVAAAKLGAETTLVARVGDDLWGEKYIKNLKDLRVDTRFVQITPRVTTGIAQINVAESGANQIVIVAAANKSLDINDLEKAQGVVSNASVLVCQIETSPDVAIAAMQCCKGFKLNRLSWKANITLTLPSIFCVNEHEAEIFANVPVTSVNDAKNAISILLEKGCKTVILTLGYQGAVLASRDSPIPEHVPSRPVQCVDSTGAGDAFIGALAYLLANRKDLSLKQCVEAANFVAADSVTRPGTQISFPGSEILEQYFKQ